MTSVSTLLEPHAFNRSHAELAERRPKILGQDVTIHLGIHFAFDPVKRTDTLGRNATPHHDGNGVLDRRDRVFGVESLVFGSPNMPGISLPKELYFALIREDPFVPFIKRFIYRNCYVIMELWNLNSKLK